MTNNPIIKALRRWGIALLCLVLTLSSLAVFAAGAETAVRLTATDMAVTAGNYVTVYLSAENLSGVGALDLYAFYDPEVMTVVSSSKQALAQNAQVSINTSTPGEACFSAISTDGISGSGRIWSIRFKVNGDVPAGRYPVTFTAGDAFDLSLNPVSIAGTTCSVTVNAVVTPPTVKTVRITGRNDYSGYRKGDTVTLSYYAVSVEDLASADFTLTYDETLLSLVSLSLGDAMTAANGALWSIHDGTPGYAKISYAALNGVSGRVDPMVQATFEVVGEIEQDCSSTVELKVENIFDSALTSMQGSTATSTVSLLRQEPEVILPEITLGDYKETEGDLFTVSVLAPGSTGLAAGDFVLTYDPTLLQCMAVESCDPAYMVVSNIKQKDGKVLFSFICEDGITEDSALARMTFRVLACQTQSSFLELTGKNPVDAEYNSLEVTYRGMPELAIVKHRLTAFEAQKPTCEAIGWQAYEACSRCAYTTYSEIPALGHRVWVEGHSWVDPVVIENDPTYPFQLNGGVYSSTNKTPYSDSYLTLTAQYDCSITISYAVSSESGYDKLIIRLNGSTVWENSGQKSWSSRVIRLTAGDVLTVNYHKDGSTDRYEDTGWFSCSYEQIEITELICVPADEMEPTCTEAVVCHFCDAVVKAALGHTPAAPVVENRVEPTCTEQGSYDSVVYCVSCNVEVSREAQSIDELGHNYSPNWTVDLAPTCTEVGSKSHRCDRCGHKTDITEIPANGHKFGEWYVVTVPTCTEAGLDEQKCSVCGHTETRVTDALGHTPAAPVVENRVEPTCTEQGSYDSVVYCSVCDDELSREEQTIDELGHSYSPDWTIDIQPTCTEVGSKSHHCDRCGHKTDITEIPANGHSFGEWYEVTTPTCTETGLDERKCSVCGHTETRVTDALGHKPAAPVEENRAEPTCTEQGSYDSVVYCSVCHAELSREGKTLEVPAHEYKVEITSPSCTERGYTTHTCIRCGDVFTDSETEAIGHTPSEWMMDVEPIPGVEGIRHKECTVCGETLETDVVEALPLETEAESDSEVTPDTDPDSAGSDDASSGGCSSTVYTHILSILLMAPAVALFAHKRRKVMR